MWTGIAPLGGRTLQLKIVILAMREAQEVAFVVLFDGEIALHSEIDQSGRDIPHGGLVINERAALAGRELVGWLVLNHDGAQCGVTAARPPEPEHDEKRDNGNKQRPIAAQEQNELHRRGGWLHNAFVPADHSGEPFVIPERMITGYLDDVVFRFDGCSALSRSVNPSERNR